MPYSHLFTERCTIKRSPFEKQANKQTKKNQQHSKKKPFQLDPFFQVLKKKMFSLKKIANSSLYF